MKKLGFAFFLVLLLLAPRAGATQSTINPTVPVQGAPIQSAPIRNNFAAAYSDINNLYGIIGGISAPGGSVNQIQYNANSRGFGGLTVGGDCTLAVPSGTMICTKTNGVSFAPSATTDTTQGVNISLGTSNSQTGPHVSGDLTTGLYSATASTVSIASGGVNQLTVNPVGLAMYGVLTVNNGSTAARPTPATGMLRYNTTLGALETYVNSAWQQLTGPPGKFYAGWYGALGISSDDCPAVQSALNAAQSYNAGGVVVLDSIVYACQTTLSYDPARSSVEGNGAVFDARNLSSGFFMNVVQSGALPLPGNNYYPPYKNSFRDVAIIGPGRASTTDLFNFTSTTPYNSRSTFQNISAWYFRNGETYGTNSYLVNFSNTTYAQMTNDIYSPAGCSNCGENNVHIGGALGESDVVVNNGAVAEFNFTNMSFDFDHQYVLNSGGQINFLNPHFENNGTTAPGSLFVVSDTDGSVVRVQGGLLQTDDGLLGYAPVSVGSKGTFVARDLFVHNMTNTSNSFCTGSGRCIVSGTRGFQTALGVSSLQTFSSTIADTKNANLLVDGGFESSTPQDLVFIGNDTQPIISRLTGANLLIATSTATAHSGSQSLALTKTFGSGSASLAYIMVPISQRPMALANLWYAKPGAQTGTVYIAPYFLHVNGFDGNGIPIIQQSYSPGSSTITLTSSAIAWTNLSSGEGENNQAPAWANYYGIQINLGSMNAGSFYLDDINLSTM